MKHYIITLQNYRCWIGEPTALLGRQLINQFIRVSLMVYEIDGFIDEYKELSSNL
jgi:hypothetical protein